MAQHISLLQLRNVTTNQLLQLYGN